MTTGAEYKASLWQIQENSTALQELVELKPHSGIIRRYLFVHIIIVIIIFNTLCSNEMFSVLWDNAGKSDYVVSIDESNVRLFDLDANFTNPKVVFLFSLPFYLFINYYRLLLQSPPPKERTSQVFIVISH